MNGLKLHLLFISFWIAPLWASPTVADNTSISPPLELNYLVIIGQSAPLQMLDAQGEATGIVSDLVKTMVSDHYPLAITRLPFKRMLHEISSGRKKNWISYGASAWSGIQGRNIVDCELHRSRHSLITLKSEEKIDNLQDLHGKRLILLHGFNFQELNTSLNNGKIKQIRVKNYDSAFRSLDAKRGIGFIEMDFRIRYNLNITERNIADYDIQDVSHIIKPYSVFLSLDPTMPSDTRDFLTERCQQLQKQGYIDALHKKYQP